MRFNEHIFPASISDLQKEMQKNKDLDILLNTVARDLEKNIDTKKYTYLIGELLPEYQNNTLLDIVETSLRLLPEGRCYFSVNDSNSLRGFIAYVKGQDNYVRQIKTFSFNPTAKDLTLATDLENFVVGLCSKYDFVSWSAITNNPVNVGYQIALNKFKRQKLNCYVKTFKETTRYFASELLSEDELKTLNFKDLLD